MRTTISRNASDTPTTHDDYTHANDTERLGEGTPARVLDLYPTLFEALDCGTKLKTRKAYHDVLVLAPSVNEQGFYTRPGDEFTLVIDGHRDADTTVAATQASPTPVILTLPQSTLAGLSDGPHTLAYEIRYVPFGLVVRSAHAVFVVDNGNALKGHDVPPDQEIA